MSLAQIVYPPPTAHGFTEWSFWHYQHHLAIIAAAKTKGFALNQYQIWPIDPNNMQTFLEQHQSMHDEMNAASGVFGSDLQDLDFSNKKIVDAWFYTQYVEHQSVASFLGGGT